MHERETFTSAVLAHFLETGRPATRAEMQERLRCSSTKLLRLEVEAEALSLKWTYVDRTDRRGRVFSVDAVLPSHELLRRELIKRGAHHDEQ